MNKRKILLWYDRILGACFTAAAGLIVCECLKIYDSAGPDGAPFTRQSISSAFGEKRIFIFAVIGLTLIGLVLHRVFPHAEKAFRAAPCNAAGPRGHISLIRIITAALSLTFIVLGLMNGGHNDLWVKAVRICSECIGLG